MGDADIKTLTMQQYFPLTSGNQAPGEVKLEIEGNVNFKIKSQFMREDTFSGNKNDDSYEHVERILDIVSLFNILGVTLNTVMLCVFPITFTGAVKRWVDRLFPGTINTWDLLKNAFIQRYNDLLYKCPTHDLNNHQKVNIFYNWLHTMNRQLLDSQGPIPNKTSPQALTAIQTMADHSQKWHKGSTSRRVSNDNSTGIAAITNKLDNLGRGIKKLKENVHAIQVGCENYRGVTLTRNNLETRIEHLEKDYKAKAANEVQDPSVGQCKVIFADNKALTDEASSKGTTEL
ncbi:hypothetical protein Tco_0340046 [Tanacetum coccineum]